MKKQLLTGAFVLASFFAAQAQVVSYDFNDYTIGNIGTNLTGEEVGQGDWLTFGSNGDPVTSNITNANFQVIEGNGGKVLQLTGPDGASGGAFMFQDPQATLDAWAERTEGNDIYQVEYLYYTGTPGDSKNGMGLTVFANSQTSIILCGAIVDTSTNEFYGRAYVNNAGTNGNFLITFGAQGETLVLPDNTWVKIGTSFNKVTGEVIFKVATVAGEILLDNSATPLAGAAAGNDPVEVDVNALNVSAGNTVAAVGLFDNIKVSMVAEDSLLGTKDVSFEQANLSVYPNPASDVVNVSVDALVSNVAIVDLNGRTVKSVKFDGVSTASVNVSDLASGIYMMTVSSDKGTTTKKIVKN